MVIIIKQCRMLELKRCQIEKEVFFVKQAKKESKMLILKRRKYLDFDITYVGIL